MEKQRFFKVETIKKKDHFKKTYAYRCSFANKYLVMYIRKNGLQKTRLGISISKKIGNSVIRHRYSRLIKEAFRLNQFRIKKNFDIVLVARKQIVGKNYYEVEAAIIHLLKMHRLYDKCISEK